MSSWLNQDQDPGLLHLKQPLIARARPYLVPERPRQQSIILPSHDHDEEGQVGPLPRPIPVQVEPQAQLVSVLGGVES